MTLSFKTHEYLFLFLLKSTNNTEKCLEVFCIYFALHYDIVYSLGRFALQKILLKIVRKNEITEKIFLNKAVTHSFSSSSSLFSASNVSDSIHPKSWLIHYHLELYNGSK